jgi:hypothetical protein
MATEQCWRERERETYTARSPSYRTIPTRPATTTASNRAREESSPPALLAQELFDTALGPPDYARTTPRTLLETFLQFYNVLQPKQNQEIT